MIPICRYCRSSNVRIKEKRGQIFLICQVCGKITNFSDDEGGGISPLVI